MNHFLILRILQKLKIEEYCKISNNYISLGKLKLQQKNK